ncbi:MAG: nickel-dependent lactate racemase [Desulforhopalus sp.]
MKIQLPKGRDTLHATIPDGRISDIIVGKDVPGLSEKAVRGIIAAGMSQHAPPRLQNKRIVIIIPDDTRRWARGDLFVPEILHCLLGLGVSRDNIKILIALGTHRDICKRNFANLAGNFAAQSITILNSANNNADRLLFVGETSRKTAVHMTKEAVEADHIIIYGGVLHHMAAGYGGGRKYIFPGIAGYSSIQQNHSLAIEPNGSPHPMVRQAQLTGNPIHEDITEAAELFLRDKTCTYVGVAANGHGEIFHAQVGPLEETFRDCCRKLDEVSRVTVPHRVDFAIISAGGSRSDGQLYQATKALFNVTGVVREGGKILFVAGCSEGTGNEIFGDALKCYRENHNALGKKLTAQFNMPSYVACRVMDILKRFEIALLSDLEKQETVELGFNYVEDLQNYVNTLRGKGYVIPYAENIFPVSQQA